MTKKYDKRPHFHYQIVMIIKKFGRSVPKINGHGSDYTLEMSNGWKIFLDDYNMAIRIYDECKRDLYKCDSYKKELYRLAEYLYVGMDFGGFSFNVNENTYKYILGTIAKTRWRQRQSV